MAELVFVERAVREALRGGEVAAIVGERVYAITIPQGTPLPCVVYQRTNSSPLWTTRGYVGERVTMIVNCFSPNHDQAKALALAVRRAMHAPPLEARFITDKDYYNEDAKTYCVWAEYACMQNGGLCYEPGP